MSNKIDGIVFDLKESIEDLAHEIKRIEQKVDLIEKSVREEFKNQ